MGRSATSTEASRIDHLAIEREARQLRDENLAAALSTFGRVVGRLARRVAAWRERRATYAELVRLDDRMLADIGLNRGEIQAAAEFGQLPSRSHDASMVDIGAQTSEPFIGRPANYNRPYKAA
ncbi:MAG: DUF1127 domain-containing protein [Proteobacteria bacterium]|nr:DUF1127 domain-containing protein [Pseudomonadota bacterium]MBI3497735.1 DUF1127 domain-containing protein [Pseudomonadota bacterium]